MAIGIAPGSAALAANKAFAGNSLQRLKRWFERAGFPLTEEQLRASIYLTSLNKCSVTPDNAANRLELWKRCQRFLWRQLALIEPRLVLLLGREPAGLLTKQRQRPLEDFVGTTYSTEQIFGNELFPPVAVSASWLVLPHPSGMSRLMNDPAIAHKVIASLRLALLQLGPTVEQQ